MDREEPDRRRDDAREGDRRAQPAPARRASGPDWLHPAAEGCARGALPPNVVLLRLAMAAHRPEEVEAALVQALERVQGQGVGRLRDALPLWRANPQAFATVKAVLDGVVHEGAAEDPAREIAHWAGIYDRLAESTPEEGVALYALGNPELLRAATAEVAARLSECGGSSGRIGGCWRSAAGSGASWQPWRSMFGR